MVGQDPFGVASHEVAIDIVGYEPSIFNIWARDDRYDIWGKGNDGGSSDLDNTVSVINIPESP